MLDLRPILAGIEWGANPEGYLSLHSLARRFAPRCPPGFRVTCHGGQPEPPPLQHFLRFNPGDTFTVFFEPVPIGSWAARPLPPSGSSLDDEWDPPAEGAAPDSPYPGTGGVAHTTAAVSRQGYAVGDAASHRATPQHTRLCGRAGGVGIWWPTFCICLGAVLRPNAAVQLPATGAPHRIDPVTATWADREITWTAAPQPDAHICGPQPDTSVLSAPNCHAPAVGPRERERPIPTPSRATGLPPPVQTAPESLSAIAPHIESTNATTDGPFHIQTLLEECVQFSTRPYFIAATLLDTLLEHFGDTPDAAASARCQERPATVRLAEHLPTERAFDLTRVQLPVGCSIDDLAALLTPLRWELAELPKLHLGADIQQWLDTWTPASSATPSLQGAHLCIYTDGSFNGQAAAWAFHVCAYATHGFFHLGWSGDRVPTSSEASLFLGARCAGAFQAELTALFWALCWCLQLPSPSQA